jgi:hypothetical protein
MTAPICPYCGAASVLVTGADLYPHRPDLRALRFYRCARCDAHVGCHPGTTNPLGRIANAELRRAKSAAHAAFDPLWKRDGLRRSEAYAWLAKALSIPPAECHIGMFDVDRCRATVAACRARRS